MTTVKETETSLSGSGCIDSGDTTWVLISTVLVLGMMPGLAFFEAGLLRAKNTISIMTQTITGIIVLSVLWDVIGFSFVYGDTLKGVIGNPASFPLLFNVSYYDCSPHAPQIPAAAYAIFEMMFACITPLLMTGAVAERLKFKCFFIFTIAWEIFVFYPVAHWIWGDGWMSKLGVVDFAGGIVIHTTAGVGALVLALMLGRRHHFDQYDGEFPPSNLPLAGIGATLLWLGWFGFNAGSALTSGAVATSTIVSTQIAAAVSGLVWMIISWYRGQGTARKVPAFVAVINGVVAGLAGITPASGYIDTQPSLALGLILGLSSYFSTILFKHKLRIDDALDVSSVHGVTGIVGSLAIGFIATSDANKRANVNGWFYHHPRQLWVQLVGVVVSGVYAAIVTYIIAKILDKTFGLRITREQEEEGLDAVEHGEMSYHHTFHNIQSDMKERFEIIH